MKRGELRSKQNMPAAASSPNEKTVSGLGEEWLNWTTVLAFNAVTNIYSKPCKGF
jgi:hypothetical protein